MSSRVWLWFVILNLTRTQKSSFQICFKGMSLLLYKLYWKMDSRVCWVCWMSSSFSLIYKTLSFSFFLNTFISLPTPTNSYLLFLSSLTSKMSFNPFTDSSNFVELLHSQQNVVFGNVSDSVSLSSLQVPFLASQGTGDSNFGEDTPTNRKERRTWTPTDDVVLINSWLNTRKDPVVGNEQRSVAFWKRIVAYFSASPKIAPGERREASHYKQRWHKMNDLVCKFCGAYEAATRE